MFPRPHQRAGLYLIFIGAMFIVAIARAHAAPPPPPTDSDANAAVNEPAAVDNDEPAADDAEARPRFRASDFAIGSDGVEEEADAPPGAREDESAEAEAQPANESTPLPVPERELRPLGVGSGEAETTEGDTSPQSGSWVLQTVTALAIVIGLIFMLRALLMRLTGTQAGVGANRLVEVLARATIGHKTQVVFLKINQRVVVVGQTPAGMDTLTEIDDPEEVAWLLGEVEAAKPRSISQSFRSVMQRFDKDFSSTEETGTDASEQYVDRTRDELSGLLSRIRHLKDRPGGDR